MTNKMRNILLMDAINRHRGLTVHTGDCCVQARITAQAMVEEAEAAEKAPEAPAAAPVVQPLPVQAASAGGASAPRTRYGAREGSIASPRQIRYIQDLLEIKDVPNNWRRIARELILQDYPSYTEAQRVLNILTKLRDMPGAVRMVTPPMVGMIDRLLNQKQWAVPVDPKTLTFREARELIDALKIAPNKPRDSRPVPSPEDSKSLPDEGMYLFEGSYFKIQIDVHGDGRKMCKKLYPGTIAGDKGVFRRLKGMGGKLTAEHKLTLEAAKEFGRLYGQCVCCGAVLTNEESIEKGIGPICEGNWF